MPVFESVQGLVPMNVHPKCETIKEIFFLYRVNGAFLINVARERVK